MRFKHLLDISLSLFDGSASAGAGDGAGAAAPDADSGAKGGSQAIPGSTRRGKFSGESQGVLYGKQAAAAGETPEIGQTKPPDAAEDTNPTAKPATDNPADKRKAFMDLVNGEYKDVYTNEIQRIIDRRFGEVQTTLEQQASRNQPVIDLLMQRYKIEDGDVSKLTTALENDNAYWNEAAAEAGMSVDQYKRLQNLQRENASLLQTQHRQQNEQAAQAQLQKWSAEAKQVMGVYPSFDLTAESRNPKFSAMLRSGVPMQHAYEVIHIDDIKAGVAQSTAKQTEKQVVDGIRAKGARPAENGTSSQSAFTVKDDVSKLTRKDREEIARRVARGERITF